MSRAEPRTRADIFTAAQSFSSCAQAMRVKFTLLCYARAFAFETYVVQVVLCQPVLFYTLKNTITAVKDHGIFSPHFYWIDFSVPELSYKGLLDNSEH